MKLEVWMRLRFCWMDEWLCSSTCNKDNVEALDKCALLARFISFLPSTYPWMENKVWCSKAWSKREIVQKFVTPTYTHDLDYCEIFVVSKILNANSSYVLKRANIIGDVVDVDGMKVVGIPKARKWWKKLSDLEKTHLYFYVRRVSWSKSTCGGKIDRIYEFLSTISYKSF